MPIPDSPSSRLHFSGRALGLFLAVVGTAGAMAFFRSRPPAALVWAGQTSSNQAALPGGQIANLAGQNQAQEVVADRVGPAVVYVNVTAKPIPHPGQSADDAPPDNPFSQFFGPNGPMSGHSRAPQYEQGLGSGVIISPDGFIVTNNHVVQDATDILVTLKDQRTFAAKVVGTDVLTDLAVIKIDATGLPNLPWGDSRQVKQGDTVFAFGDPFGLTFTMTRGIVSGLGRIAPDRQDAHQPGDYIQTDATINPGNSGGPLVNVRGEVIGINAFIYTSTGSFSGAGFAIPAEVASPTTKEIITHGKVVRGYIGVSIVDLAPEMAQWFHYPLAQKGALVSDVEPDTPAARAGMQPGDAIVSFNGTKLLDSSQLQVLTGQVAPGTRVDVGILRDGKPETVKLTIAALPEAAAAAPAAKPAASTAAGVQLGVTLLDLSGEIRDELHLPAEVKGAAIETVHPGGPAFNAELSEGDVITEVDRVPEATAADLLSQLKKIPAGQDVLVRIYTGGDSGYAYVVVHPSSITGSGDTISTDSGMGRRQRGGGGGRP